ncbi:hypothetical protein D3C71_1358870 [compost metagenome]
MQDLLLKLSFILNVAYQDHDFDAIASVADDLQALAANPSDEDTIKSINKCFGEGWTIEEVNKDYGFNYGVKPNDA